MLCAYCGKGYGKYKSKYCSAKCLDKGTKLDRKKPTLVKKCAVCSAEFETADNNHRYCSNDCRKTIKNKKAAEIRESKLIVKSCAYCGKETTRQRYCSDRCSRMNSYVAKKKHELLCSVCGIRFESHNIDKKQCSKSCHMKSPEYKKHKNSLARKKRAERRKLGLPPVQSSKQTPLARASRRRYKSRYRHACPKWVKNSDLAEIEELRKQGQEEDHIVPLNHPDVCGLHVPWNLHHLTADANNFKSNKFDGTSNNKSWIEEYRDYLKEIR